MPRINVKCKNCNEKYRVGDFLPTCKNKCPKCGIKDNIVIGYNDVMISDTKKRTS